MEAVDKLVREDAERVKEMRASGQALTAKEVLAGVRYQGHLPAERKIETLPRKR